MSDEMKRIDGEEPPATAEEREAAARLAGELDALLAGEAAEGGDENLAAAVMLRAAEGKEQGLQHQTLSGLLNASLARHDQLQAERRKRLRRVAPMMALAATLTLVLSATLFSSALLNQEEPLPAPARETLSRSSDALMGKPFNDRAGASARLDRVFADRLRGYRHLALAGGGAR
jgi:hypothetical protein